MNARRCSATRPTQAPSQSLHHNIATASKQGCGGSPAAPSARSSRRRSNKKKQKKKKTAAVGSGSGGGEILKWLRRGYKGGVNNSRQNRGDKRDFDAYEFQQHGQVGPRSKTTSLNALMDLIHQEAKDTTM